VVAKIAIEFFFIEDHQTTTTCIHFFFLFLSHSKTNFKP